MKISQKIIIVLVIILVIIAIFFLGYKFINKTKLAKEFNSKATIEKNVNWGEYAEISDENLKVSITDINYDETNNKFSYTIDFSTINENGLSSYILYDWIIYDANKKVIANNSFGISSPEKKKFFLGFASQNYNRASFKTLTDHNIGMISGGNVMSENGTVKQTFEGTLSSVPKLQPLTFRLSNIQYKEQGQQETINTNTDLIFIFNK